MLFMKTLHLLEVVSKKGENGDICNKSGPKKESNDGCSHTSNMLSLGGILCTYFRVFVYYAKARSNVYIFAFATLVSMILGSHGHVDPIIAGSVIVASYFMALATYIYNDATDFEVDKINKTNRPSVTGKTTKRQLIIMVSILNFGALLLVALVTISVSHAIKISIYPLLISISFIAIGVAYSHPKSNLKDKFPLKTVVTAAGAALLSLLGGTAASSGVGAIGAVSGIYANDIITTTIIGTATTIFSLPICYAALFFFAFFFILGPLGDIADLKGDRTVGRRTFPIVIGIRSTLAVMLSMPLTIISMTIPLILLPALVSSSSSFVLPLTHLHGYHNDIMHLRMIGICLIIGACSATLTFVFKISKNTNDVLAIKSSRPKMRFLHVMLQVSLLIAFV
jgi:geranylgeranylglycerol-phosphate geranylgeranyltransferase